MDESPEGNTRPTNSNGARFPEAWSRGTEFVRPQQRFGMGENGQQGEFDIQPTHREAYIYQSPPMFHDSTHTESTPTPLFAYKVNHDQVEPRFTPSPVGYTTQYHQKKSLNPAIVATFSGRISTPNSDSGIGSSQEEQPQNSVFSEKDTSENLDIQEYSSEEQESMTEEQELLEQNQCDLALKEDEILETENSVMEDPMMKVEKNKQPILKHFPTQLSYDEKLFIIIPKPTTENTCCFSGIIANIRKAAREFRKTIALGREKEYDEVDDKETY